MKEYDLVSLRSFVAVVETGSFYNAAVQMEASSAAISRRVSSLEDALGVRLLNRTTRQLELTVSGQQFWEDVKQILQALEQAEERLTHSQEMLTGVIKMAAPMTFGVRKLAPLLPEFLALYPHITLQLKLEDKLTDIVGDGFDISLRISELRDSSLVSNTIAVSRRVFCASPAYIEEYGTPETPDELQGHAAIRYSRLSARDEWGLLEGFEVPDMRVPLVGDNGDLICQAALQGIGIALLPWFIVDDAVESGKLVTLLEEYAPAPLPISLVRPSRHYTPARVIALMEWLRQKLSSL